MVLSPSSKIVFCEGKTDVQFLNKFFKSSSEITIKDTGSKRGMPSFAKGYSNSTSRIAIRDRDLDFEPSIDGKLVSTGKNWIWATNKSSIESYFLDEKLIFDYLEWKSSTPNYKSKSLPIPPIDELSSFLTQAAKNIQFYEAARWALADAKSSILDAKFDDKWFTDSGKIPISEKLDKDNNYQEAHSMIVEYLKKMEVLNTNKLLKDFEKRCTQFSSNDFYENKEYLVWFHGKDLKTSFSNIISTEFAQNWHFSFDTYLNDYCKIERTELQFDISKHIDLVELKDKIANLK